MNEVTIPIKILVEDPKIIGAYARLKAGLKINDPQSIKRLTELGYIKRKEEPQQQFSQISRVKRKIKRFQVKKDLEPFNDRWDYFVKQCYALKRTHCNTIIMYHLKYRLEERSKETGIEMNFPRDWVKIWRGFALKMTSQYPDWSPEDWKKAVDWFSNDDFWSEIIIDTKTMSKHLARYVSWRQKKEPHKKTISGLKIIGRKK